MAEASQAFTRARALCVELARVTGARPMQYRLVAPIAQSIGLDAAAADAAVTLAIEQKWLIRSGERPHTIRLTDEGRHLTIINGYGR
jgi:hypothetical protein